MERHLLQHVDAAYEDNNFASNSVSTNGNPCLRYYCIFFRNFVNDVLFYLTNPHAALNYG
jgi:hypothetical protein